jgi:hypothetical protein
MPKKIKGIERRGAVRRYEHRDWGGRTIKVEK